MYRRCSVVEVVLGNTVFAGVFGFQTLGFIEHVVAAPVLQLDRGQISATSLDALDLSHAEGQRFSLCCVGDFPDEYGTQQLVSKGILAKQ